ncbi:MAG: Flp pilus assembly complex ATPase component TadA [Alphaproteobacteria bacterium]|nr:Flp pilus assembly complex ATPase component TadA [Alphaproteobacteria bacterium]MBN2674949.1 Flp pilus assembly complex ATPase component TadA [Alphaproteobacteria bacterium]
MNTADKILNKKRDNNQLSIPVGLENTTNKDIVDYLFSDGNRLLTATAAEMELSKDTQNLVAYFSGGEVIISRTHRYDGRVLAFLDLLSKEGRAVLTPFYSDLGLLSSIYKTYEGRLGGGDNKSRLDYDNQMQKDFVDIIGRASLKKVSDIHIEVADQTTIYFRMDGSMHPVLEYNSQWGESFVRAAFASADISNSNYAQNEYQSAQKDGRTPLRGTKDLYLPDGIIGIRMQFNPVAFGSRYVVMRLLYDNPSEGIKTEQEFNVYEQKLLMRLRSYPTGLVVVAGPTSSGKSTTLVRNMSMMLKERNYEINLITVEDPAEQKIFGAHQMPVVNTANEEQREEKFTEALAAALRSDPDTLMVGEIRTLSAAQLTVKGALSGHNVWTTLHANSAMAALTRLLDIGVEGFKLKDETMMRGLVSMRLFKKLCPHCREKLSDNPNHPAYQRVKDSFGEIGLQQVYIRGAGCEECKGSGTAGRIKSGEIIITDNEFLRMALSGDTAGATRYWLEELDGRTLKESAMELMLQGIIGVDELERWVGLLDQPGVY